jgi:dephospho-CoA kinase
MKKKEIEVPLPDGKGDSKQLKEYFKKIVPEYDEEKVHQSDMKKMVKWYRILKQHNLIPEEEKENVESEEPKEKAETKE